MIAIIDYGMGNLRSVQKAFEYLGFEAQITDDPAWIAGASPVVLPGVGAFCDAMARLRESGQDRRCWMPQPPASLCWAYAWGCR